MLITNSKLYDQLKWVAQIGLPAAGTLYVALAAIWSWGDVQAVSGSVLAVDTFMGALLSLSSSAYKASDAAYDGSVDVNTDASGKKTFSLNLNGDPNELDKQAVVSFKVNPSNQVAVSTQQNTP